MVILEKKGEIKESKTLLEASPMNWNRRFLSGFSTLCEASGGTWKIRRGPFDFPVISLIYFWICVEMFITPERRFRVLQIGFPHDPGTQTGTIPNTLLYRQH